MKQPWKYGLVLVPCVQCEGDSGIQYKCIRCNDFGELWLVGGRWFRQIGTLDIEALDRGELPCHTSTCREAPSQT